MFSRASTYTDPYFEMHVLARTCAAGTEPAAPGPSVLLRSSRVGLITCPALCGGLLNLLAKEIEASHVPE